MGGGQAEIWAGHDFVRLSAMRFHEGEEDDGFIYATLSVQTDAKSRTFAMVNVDNFEGREIAAGAEERGSASLATSSPNMSSASTWWKISRPSRAARAAIGRTWAILGMAASDIPGNRREDVARPASLSAITRLAGAQDPSCARVSPREVADGSGKAIFAGACQGCHGWTGESPVLTCATFIGGRAINDPSARNVAQAIIWGVTRDSVNGPMVMPALDAYSDAEIAAVANYVTARFGAAPSAITAAEIAQYAGNIRNRPAKSRTAFLR